MQCPLRPASLAPASGTPTIPGWTWRSIQSKVEQPIGTCDSVDPAENFVLFNTSSDSISRFARLFFHQSSLVGVWTCWTRLHHRPAPTPPKSHPRRAASPDLQLRHHVTLDPRVTRVRLSRKQILNDLAGPRACLALPLSPIRPTARCAKPWYGGCNVPAHADIAGVAMTSCILLALTLSENFVGPSSPGRRTRGCAGPQKLTSILLYAIYY